jgi:hypothetical protein
VQRFVLVAGLMGLALGVAGTAAAQSRVPVAVLPFSGPGATAARRQAISVLETEPRVTVTDEGIADAAAQRTGAGASGADGVEGFARQIQVRVVIQGEIRGRGARRRLVLTARDAGGANIASETIARMRGGAAGRRAIASALDALLDTALAAIPPDRPRERSVSEEAAAPVAPPPVETPPSFGADPAIFTVTVGAGLRARNAAIHLDDSSERTYDASPYFEIQGRVELRPLAHEQSYARGLYAWAEAGGAPGLTSRRADGTQVSTSFYRLAASVGYLVPIGDIVEAGVGLGAGWDAYQLDDNQAMPTVEYPYLRPAVRARFRVLGETVVIGIEGGYRALFAREGLSSAFGPRGASFGWDVGGGLSGTFDFGLTYALDVGFTQYVHDFSTTVPGFIGQGTHGTDGGYRFSLSLGYAFF